MVLNIRCWFRIN